MVRLRLRDNESVQEAVRRFRKLVEHTGVKKEMRRREYFAAGAEFAQARFEEEFDSAVEQPVLPSQ